MPPLERARPSSRAYRHRPRTYSHPVPWQAGQRSLSALPPPTPAAQPCQSPTSTPRPFFCPWNRFSLRLAPGGHSAGENVPVSQILTLMDVYPHASTVGRERLDCRPLDGWRTGAGPPSNAGANKGSKKAGNAKGSVSGVIFAAHSGGCAHQSVAGGRQT
jgi:hypothetical protein